MDKHEELAKLRKLAQMKANFGLLFYKPHAKQHEFHSLGYVKRRYVRTGNRFGKSTLGGAEDCAWALGERPWYEKGDPCRTCGIPQRSTKGLIIVADWDKAHEIFTNPVNGIAQGKLFRMLPKDKILKTSKNNAGVISEISVESIYGGVSSIYVDTVKSYMSNPMGQESSDWDWIHVDEPCPQDMWIANSRGLIDREGSAWFTCTPIDQPWINDMFVPRDKFREESDATIWKGDDFVMIVGTSYDNPHNSEKALQMFQDDLTDEQRACRIQGIPLTLSGLIYKEFNQATHVYRELPYGWQSWTEPPENYTIRVAIDPHPKTPHAVLFAATAPSGEVYIFHEIFRHITATQLCEAINEIVGMRHVQIWLCDPSAYVPSNIDQSVMADVLIENGVFVEKASKDLSRGIITTQEALTKKVMSPKGVEVPWIRFSCHLQETLWEFDHYRWDPKRPNKPVDKDDHMMENFYRMVLEGFDYVEPEHIDKYKFLENTKSNLTRFEVPRQMQLEII